MTHASPPFGGLHANQLLSALEPLRVSYFRSCPASGMGGGSRCMDQAGLEGKARPPPSVELDPARGITSYIPYIIKDRETQEGSLLCIGFLYNRVSHRQKKGGRAGGEPAAGDTSSGSPKAASDGTSHERPSVARAQLSGRSAATNSAAIGALWTCTKPRGTPPSITGLTGLIGAITGPQSTNFAGFPSPEKRSFPSESLYFPGD